MMHRLARSLFVLPLLSSLALSQQLPATPLAHYSFGDIPTIAAQLPKSALGRLLADEEVAPVANAAVAWFVARAKHRFEVRAAVLDRDVELEPYYLSQLTGNDDLYDLARYPLSEMKHLDAIAFPSEDQASFRPRTLFSVACRPQFEGRWLHDFETEARRLDRSRHFTTQADAKIDGFPAYHFKAPAIDYSDNPFHVDDVWQMHVPGTYVFGTGRLPTRLEELTPPPPAVAGLSMAIDLRQYLSLLTGGGGGMVMPAPMQASGYQSLTDLRWSLRFVGDRLVDEFTLGLDAQPEGLIGALLTGAAPLPKQALPEGALAQLRMAIDVPKLSAAVQTLLAGELELPADTFADLEKAFTGGLAIGVAAPPTGGVIPRVFVSFNLADRAAYQRLFAYATEQGLPLKAVDFEGIACHRLDLPELPNGLQITFAERDGTLHFAESARSMRTLLKALADGGESMDVGTAVPVEGPGRQLPSFDLRFDEVEIYRAYRDVWLPLYALMPHDTNWSVPVPRDDLPEVETFASYCGKGRGVLRRDGNRFVLQQTGVFGGLESLALALLWPTMIAGEDTDYATRQLQSSLAKHELRVAWTALEAFHKRERRWPRDLAELYAAQQLNDDALLIAGDTMAETLTLVDGRKVRTSFRYFAEPIAVDGIDEGKVLLIEVQPHSYDRALLTVDGAVPDVYGAASNRPIEQFAR